MARLPRRNVHVASREPYTRTERPRIAVREILTVLRAIATGQHTYERLCAKAKISRATLYRLLADCERELSMRIDCDERIYSVTDWGILDRRKVLERK